MFKQFLTLLLIIGNVTKIMHYHHSLVFLDHVNLVISGCIDLIMKKSKNETREIHACVPSKQLLEFECHLKNFFLFYFFKSKLLIGIEKKI